MATQENDTRREMAEKIKQKPALYKVCEGCGSIVVRKATICPNCNAYRFDGSVEAVLAQAEELASRAPLSVDRCDYD